ncbi:MAG: type III pantothenate kinase, partial [Myxococcota bacterium]
MVVVIDVGNTNTMLGVLEGDEVRFTWRLTTSPRTTDELGGLWLQLLDHAQIGLEDIDGAICSSVVPSQVYTVQKACLRYLS